MIRRKTLKRILMSLLGGVLFLTACGQTSPAIQTVPVPAVDKAIATPSPIPTNTNTPVPTETSTATITPLPTIPTFTPTFDARTVITITPAPKAECPRENSKDVREFATPNSNGFYETVGAENVLTYLNSGGTLAQLAKGPPFDGEIIDLTGDGVSEVVFKGLVRYSILGCEDGKYQDLFDFDGDFGVYLEGTPDLNRDETSELILYDVSHYGSALLYVFEWDGKKFRSLIDAGEVDSILATSPAKFMDTNGDGLKEIVVVYDVNQLCGGFGGFCDGTPIRKQTTTLGWNGQNYVDLRQENYASPQYRFQAIQDGDWHTRYGNYAKALALYQGAIFNDQLEWWSLERELYEIQAYWSQYDPTPTVYPSPIPDNIEYSRLAAYAYYRIVLLHVVQGHESDAGTVYKTLQQKFSNDPYGRPYAEMATEFWNAYQSTHKMYDGCAAAIQYAVEHPEILIPLGSNYHGSQSHIYVPADVCPFR